MCRNPNGAGGASLARISSETRRGSCCRRPRQRLPSATADKCSIHLIADGVAPTSIQNESTLIKRGGFPLGLGDSPPPNHATRQTPSAVIFLLPKIYLARET